MAALVLTVLALGSGIDPCLCGNEAVPSMTAASGPGEAAQHTQALHTEHADGQEPCDHGHCHHAVFFTAPVPAQVGQTEAVAQRPTLARAPVVLSDLQFGLMRPPRA